MTPPFQTRFARLAAERSPLCAGIDPSRDALAGWGLADNPAGLRSFCEGMVETCAPLAAAIKPQAAFFERHGPEGMVVLRDLVRAARSHGALVIIDAKSGDIASTAAAYGEAFLGAGSAYGGDALTVSPYLGFGSLKPIVEIARRAAAGVFVVVRSSNPEGSGLQQARTPDGRTVALCLADDVAAANAGAVQDGIGPIGAVLGATLGGEAGELAARLPNALLLVPGIGAQGATIADVRRDFGAHYARALPSISRAIAQAGPDPAALRERVERFAAEARNGA
jgi:orotidine-5'-phosphate decarboxylase